MVVLPTKTPTLLKADGTEFPGGPCAVQQYTPPYDRSYAEVTMMANNVRAFSQIGDERTYIDSMMIECYAENTVQGIKNAIARESTQGLFTLRVPDLESSTVFLYLIRFFECTWSREAPRRAGFPEVFQAQITEIEVLDEDTE
jgi:hypothetical protein